MMLTNNQHKDNTGVYIFIAIIAALIILAFTSCYSERKAKSQFSRAAVAYPKLPAEYCAITYPVRDSVIRDTLMTVDTLYELGGDTFDTLVMFDTVRITHTIQLPGKIITNTFHITDTIYQVDQAALKACQLDNSTMMDLLSVKTKEADKYKGQSTKRGYIMWGLLLLIALVIGFNVYKTIKPGIKV